MTIERYMLTLVHEYIGNNGEPYQIEDPIRVASNVMINENAPPQSVVVNEMIERLKYFMLNSIEQEGRT